MRPVSLPGLTFAYSGGGYTLLQLVLEQVAQRDGHFADLVRELVFEPLGHDAVEIWRAFG